MTMKPKSEPETISSSLLMSLRREFRLKLHQETGPCSSDCRMSLARALGMKDLMKISEELVNRFDHLEKKLANLEGKVEDAKTNASKPLTNETISNIGEQTAKEIMKELDKSAKADPEQETETPTISWAQIAAKNITDQTEQLTNVVVNKLTKWTN